MEAAQNKTGPLDRFRILSGSALKMIALITMLIDHVGAFILVNYKWAATPFLTILGHGVSLYFIARKIGRLAFPIYCFLITEGYAHTHDKKRYGASLLIFALISEIPWDLEHTGRIWGSSQNVFFTLFLGYIGICAYEKFKDDPSMQLTYLAGIFVCSIFLHCDYGCRGFALIVFLHIMREKKVVQAILGSCFIGSSLYAVFAFIPINMYNGQRGFIKSKPAKYAFYIAYPLHIFIIYLYRLNTFGYN